MQEVAGHVVRKRSSKRNCTNVKNYVQTVKKIRLELDKEQIEGHEEQQGEKQTEEEEQAGMQLEESEEQRKSEQGRDEGVNNKMGDQDDIRDDDGVSNFDEEDNEQEGDSDNDQEEKDSDNEHEEEDSDNEHEEEDSDNEHEEEDSDNELCLLCDEHDTLVEGDVDTIDWIKFTKCQEWVHESCLPRGYCFDRYDDDLFVKYC